MSTPADAPLKWLSDTASRHPDVWKHIDALHSMRGGDLPNWPNWCYVPIAGGVAAATQGRDLMSFDNPLEVIRDAATITALAAWRQTKGIYQFHPELQDALWNTPVTGDLPTTILKHLPEWCVYIPLEHQLSPTETLHGAWAHLEWDANDHSEELRLLLDVNNELLAIPIDLVGSLKEGIDSVAVESIMRTGATIHETELEQGTTAITQLAEPIVSLLLYLCSEQPEIDGQGQPGNPKRTKTKKGWRTFPASNVRTWDVGARTGAALNAAKDRTGEERETLPSGRNRPRAHVRRAHWAIRWTGPRTSDQTPVLRWIAPTLIASNTQEELPATIRPVD